MENLDEFLSKGKEWFDRLIETIREYAKKLEESEKWFSTTLSSIGDAVIATDKLSNVHFMNPVAEALTGWKQEESIGKPLKDIFNIINEKTRKSVENPVLRVIREGVVVGLANHTVLITKSGKEIPIADSGAPIKDDKGNIIGVVLVFRDITERKKLEDELRMHSEIMTNMAEGVYLTRVDNGIIVYTNPKFEKMFGYNQGEMKGKHVSIVNTPTDKQPEETAKEITEILETTGEWHGEVNNIKKDGTSFWCYANVSAFDHPEYGRVWVSVHSDITEHKKALEALRENEEKLKNFMESATEGFTIYNSELNLSEINEVALRIIGMNREEMIGKHMLELSPGLENTERYDSYLNVVKTGKSFFADDVIPHPKFGDIHLSINAFKIGEGLGIIFNDVTERKKEEQKLKESEHQLSERVKELTCLYELSKLVENPNISLEAIIQGALDLIPPACQFPEITCVRINFDNKEFKTNNFKESEWNLSTRIDINDKVMFIEVYYLEDKAFLKEEESLISDFGYRLKSIIEQKETQEKLKESEVWLSTTLNSIGDAVIATDRLGSVHFMNPIAESLTGWKQEESTGKPLEEVFKIINEDTRKTVENPVSRVIREGIVVGLANHTVLIAKNGNEIPIADSGAPIKDDEGNIIGVVLTFRDITEHRNAEQKLKESEKKYREAFNRAEFYKDLFTHDINNILQNILSGIQLSEIEIGNPEKLKEFNSIIRGQLTRGAKLVSNIRKLSKLEKAEISIKKVEICSVLKESIAYVKNAYQNRNVNIQVDSIGKKFYVQANEILEDVFENLLNNSIKYNENPVVEILIKISRDKIESTNYLKMEFMDNSMGISDSRKNIIFQRGYNEEKSVQGMGLGLSLVKKIIDTYNGKIWVKDRVKGDYTKGSNFVLLIPEVL